MVPLYLRAIRHRPYQIVNQYINFSKLKIQHAQIKPHAFYCTTPPQPPTMRQKLQKTVAQYGSTVIVFHVGISLVSLGICYLLVSSGLDVEKLMTTVGISGERATKIATNAGTFAVAYAIHKVFAPARIMVTITATPFIVSHLRRMGILKKSLK